MTGSELHRTYHGAVGYPGDSPAPVVSDAPASFVIKPHIGTAKTSPKHGRSGLHTPGRILQGKGTSCENDRNRMSGAPHR